MDLEDAETWDHCNPPNLPQQLIDQPISHQRIARRPGRGSPLGGDLQAPLTADLDDGIVFVVKV